MSPSLVQMPLMLSVTALAYQEVSLEEWQRSQGSESRRQILWDAYFRRMITLNVDSRIYQTQKIPTQRQTQKWLIWIAQKLEEEGQTEFLIERIQSSWLPNKLTRTYQLIIGLALGLLIGLLSALHFWLILGWAPGLLVAGLVTLLSTRLVSKSSLSLSVRTLTWSWRRAWQGISQPSKSMLFGILLLTLARTINVGFSGGIIFGISLWLIFSLSSGLRISMIKETNYPNQGIRNSFSIGLIFTILFGGIIGLSFGFLFGRVSVGISGGFLFGLGSMLLIGEFNYCLKHLILRIFLYKSDYAPWTYSRFLDYSTERLLLQKIGGRYRFIHKQLQEHFSAMSLERL